MTMREERSMWIEGGAVETPIIEYTTSWGEPVRLAICADRYENGGTLALLALNATDPGDGEGYLEIWDVITVNLPGDPVAAAWCSEPGHVAVDANNISAALIGALVDAGVIELSGRSVRSGFCSYPLASVPPRVLAGLPLLSAVRPVSGRMVPGFA